MISKKCFSCKKILPVEDFYNNVRQTSGKQSRCKSCEIERSQYRRDLKKYPEEIKRLYFSGLCALEISVELKIGIEVVITCLHPIMQANRPVQEAYERIEPKSIQDNQITYNTCQDCRKLFDSREMSISRQNSGTKQCKSCQAARSRIYRSNPDPVDRKKAYKQWRKDLIKDD